MFPVAKQASKKPLGTPVACIKRDFYRTVCAREYYESEYVFQDAAYAVQFYTNNTTIRCCDACVRIWKSEHSEVDTSSMATRGLGGAR